MCAPALHPPASRGTIGIRSFLVRWAERQAGLSYKGVHALRHTFCSHLVMRGAVPQQVQELAGHEDLSTTQRYTRLSPEAVDSAIQLLDQPVPAWAAES